MEDKFSVLMSVYYKENAEYFDLALRSILIEQTRQPDEFVLVCDGPLTDELNYVIDKYENEYSEVFRVFRQEENQGLGKALNFGLSQCSYSLVARADSDDVCLKDRFQKQLDFMNNHTEVSIISSHIAEFDSDWSKPFDTKKLPLTHDELKKMAKVRNPLNHMAVMFRREDILELGSYRHMPYTEDYDLWVRAIIAGKKIANVDDVLVHARVGNGMVVRRSNKAQIDSWRKMNNYMLENHFITHSQKLRNMVMIKGFVYMPATFKAFLYKNVLRKRR